MKIKGFQGISTLDYPDKISSILFTPGCNFFCPYCYNKILCKEHHKLPEIDLQDLIIALKDREGFIEGIVITGGEPTIHDDLVDFIKYLKSELPSLDIKLDTNGSNPKILEILLKEKLIDYVAMDFKLPLYRYPEITDEKDIKKKITLSMEVLRKYSVPYEFRTTIAKGYISIEELEEMAFSIENGEKWFLQNFVGNFSEIMDSNFPGKPYSLNELTYIEEVIKKATIR